MLVEARNLSVRLHVWITLRLCAFARDISSRCICNSVRIQRIAALLLFAAFTGCGQSGPQTAPVKGKVTLDGKPITIGRVVTIPVAGRGANGEIASDGTFELTTFSDRDGATLGIHKVGVSAYESTGDGAESGFGRSLVPERYNNPETSNLTIEVINSGDNTAELKLTTKAANK
jgi:hypothetical protein